MKWAAASLGVKDYLVGFQLTPSQHRCTTLHIYCDYGGLQGPSLEWVFEAPSRQLFSIATSSNAMAEETAGAQSERVNRLHTHLLLLIRCAIKSGFCVFIDTHTLTQIIFLSQKCIDIFLSSFFIMHTNKSKAVSKNYNFCQVWVLQGLK